MPLDRIAEVRTVGDLAGAVKALAGGSADGPAQGGLVEEGR